MKVLLIDVIVIMKPQTHNDFRKSVCLGCHKPGARRKVSPKSKLELKVREKIFSGYSAEDMGLPVGLCGGCERAIYKDKPFPSLGVNYDKLKVPVRMFRMVCAVATSALPGDQKRSSV